MIFVKQRAAVLIERIPQPPNMAANHVLALRDLHRAESIIREPSSIDIRRVGRVECVERDNTQKSSNDENESWFSAHSE